MASGMLGVNPASWQPTSSHRLEFSVPKSTIQQDTNDLMNSTPLIIASALVTGCGTYEPPQPGRHRAPGEAVAETTCTYESPTATRFITLRCRSTEDMKRTAEQARDAADTIRAAPPEIR